MVGVVGLEPTRRRTPTDFKSVAWANSATPRDKRKIQDLHHTRLYEFSESIKCDTGSALLYNRCRTPGRNCGRGHSPYIPRVLCGLSQQIYLYPASAQRGGPRRKHTTTNDRRGSGSSIHVLTWSALSVLSSGLERDSGLR